MHRASVGTSLTGVERSVTEAWKPLRLSHGILPQHGVWWSSLSPAGKLRLVHAQFDVIQSDKESPSTVQAGHGPQPKWPAGPAPFVGQDLRVRLTQHTPDAI